jgi:hypothetical protein
MFRRTWCIRTWAEPTPSLGGSCAQHMTISGGNHKWVVVLKTRCFSYSAVFHRATTPLRCTEGRGCVRLAA